MVPGSGQLYVCVLGGGMGQDGGSKERQFFLKPKHIFVSFFSVKPFTVTRVFPLPLPSQSGSISYHSLLPGSGEDSPILRKQDAASGRKSPCETSQ